MADTSYPVTVAVRRPDGTIEHVRVGTAARRGDSFSVKLDELTIGGSAAPAEAPRRAAPAAGAPGGMVFPNYGRSKGAPISGASVQDLEFYASGARRSLADPSKSRFHEKERQLLAAVEAELARQGVAPPRAEDTESGTGRGTGSRTESRTESDDEYAPPPRDDDAPPY
jgi:hypothetical protein